ncbi:Nitrogen permease regulator 3, partial [Linderina macrospora]
MVHGLPGKQWGHTHQGKGMARALVEQADVIVTGRELREHRHGLYPRIKPYHALLLLGDTDALRQQLLFADASPTLVAVIERATPTKTLAMLHTLVDCSFAQLCRLVAHLVYWNVARVVCPVNLGYTYIPTLEQLAPALISQFNSQGFRLCSLPKLLALLHPPRPVIHVLEALGLNEKPKPSSSAKDDGGRDLIRHERRAELREMIVFLLRQGAVAQFHTWPILLVPNYVKFDLDQEQFVSLALAWFSTLYTEHPDLLGAFPQSLLNSGEIEKWAYGLKHDREAGDDVGAAFRQVEYQAVMCKVMCKIALRRVRDKWIERMHEKHGQELRRMERQMAEEEQKVNAFCARLEQQKFDVWGQTKIRFSTYIEMQTRQRSKALDEDGPPVFTAHNPDMATFTREVVEKYVTF